MTPLGPTTPREGLPPGFPTASSTPRLPVFVRLQISFFWHKGVDSLGHRIPTQPRDAESEGGLDTFAPNGEKGPENMVTLCKTQSPVRPRALFHCKCGSVKTSIISESLSWALEWESAVCLLVELLHRASCHTLVGLCVSVQRATCQMDVETRSVRRTQGGQRTQLSCFNVSFFLENIFVFLCAFPFPPGLPGLRRLGRSALASHAGLCRAYPWSGARPRQWEARGMHQACSDRAREVPGHRKQDAVSYCTRACPKRWCQASRRCRVTSDGFGW